MTDAQIGDHGHVKAGSPPVFPGVEAPTPVLYACLCRSLEPDTADEFNMIWRRVTEIRLFRACGGPFAVGWRDKYDRIIALWRADLREGC